MRLYELTKIYYCFNSKGDDVSVKQLSIINQMKKTKCFTGDLIDNQRSLKFCVQNPDLLNNL